MNNIPPKVKVETLLFKDSSYCNYGLEWKARDLADFAKEKKYPIFDLPLAGIDIQHLPFDIESLNDFIFQMKRVENASLEYPIILDNNGCIADGYHRVAKAILEGKRYIKAIRLQEMPTKAIPIKEE